MKQALICFLKYPEPGNVKTRLAEDLGETHAAHLYESLAERVLTEVFPSNQQYKLVLCVDPKHPLSKYRAWTGLGFNYWPQEGEDLGERMRRAAARAFAEGAEKVAIIGTDCIGMDEEFIGEVFDTLGERDVVIGPSSDGGYYLIAFKEAHPWLFEKVAWSTQDVLDTTTQRLEDRKLNFRLLEEKIDIDTIDDLVTLRETLPEEHFLAKKIDLLILDRLSPNSQDYDTSESD